MSHDNDDSELGEYPPPKGAQGIEQPEQANEHHYRNRRFTPLTHEVLPLNSLISKILATLIAAGIVALTTISVSTARKVDILLDRPIPVTKEQYEREQAWIQRQIDELKRRPQ